MKQLNPLRRVTRGALAPALAAFCALPLSSSAEAQSQVALNGATSVGGVSLDESFYQLVADGYFTAQDRGRVVISDGSMFHSSFQSFNDDLDYLENVAGIDIFDWIISGTAGLPDLQAAVVALDAAVRLICGGGTLTFVLQIPLSSIARSYTIDSAHAYVLNDVLHYRVKLNNVGVMYALETGIQLTGSGGSGPCELTEFHSGFSGYDEVQYDVRFSRTPQGEFDVSCVVESFGSFVNKIPDFSSVGSFTADAIYARVSSQQFDQAIQDYISNIVTAELEIAAPALFGKYLPSSAGFQDLSGSAQNSRFGKESVTASASDRTFLPMEPWATPGKVQRSFLRGHSDVSVPAASPCVAPDLGFTDNTSARPPFDGESNAMGIVYFDSVAWNHPTEAGVQSQVGRRELSGNGVLGRQSAGAEFRHLAPEIGGNFSTVLNDTASPIAPIPLAPHQISALTSMLGTETFDDLTVQVKQCPLATYTLPYDLGTAGGTGGGEVWQEVLLEVNLVQEELTGPRPIASESYRAVFKSDLRLRHVPGRGPGSARTDVTAGGAELVELYTQLPAGGELSSLQVTGTTQTAQAPLSLLFRGLFGDQAASQTQSDPRVMLFIEALAAPFVERAAHGMVALPSLDYPELNVAPFVVDGAVDLPVVSSFHGDYKFGFTLEVPPLCASIQRWGRVDGRLGGQPSAQDEMLAIEVEWSGWDPYLAQETRTGSGVTVVTASSPSGTYDVNPSRWDDGYVEATYMPVPGYGDGTRVLYASGAIFGDTYSSGLHYVVASVAGLERVKALVAQQGYLDATIEFRPYRVWGSSVLCANQYPLPTDPPPAGHHHEAYPSTIWEALEFQTEYACGQREECRDDRWIWVHSAPLGFACPQFLTSDLGKFQVTEIPLRYAPDFYDYTPCTGSGGEGGGPFEEGHEQAWD